MMHKLTDLEPFSDSGGIDVTPGNYSITGPRCMIKQMDGLREGRCIDGDSGESQPRGETQVFPCVHRWVQFFSFGDNRLAPKGSIFFTIPQHTVQQIHRQGHSQIPYMCLGVWGRGNADEGEWSDDERIEQHEETDLHGSSKTDSLKLHSEDAWEPLSGWMNEQIYSTQCSNKGAVIEWLFVPYIIENESNAPIVVTDTENEAYAIQQTNQAPVCSNESFRDCMESLTPS
jgi:hypothetical protein